MEMSEDKGIREILLQEHREKNLSHEFFNISQAASYLDLTERRFKSIAREFRIPFRFKDREYQYRKSDLDDFLTDSEIWN